MTCNLYVIKDKDIGHTAPPFVALSDEEAKAMVRDAIQPGSALHLYPSHYHLVCIGSYDAISCSIISTAVDTVCSIGDLVGRLPAPEIPAKEVDDE